MVTWFGPTDLFLGGWLAPSAADNGHPFYSRLLSFIAKAEFAAAVVLPLVHGVGGAVQETKARPHIKDMKGQSLDFEEYSMIQGYFLYTHSNIMLLLIGNKFHWNLLYTTCTFQKKKNSP